MRSIGLLLLLAVTAFGQRNGAAHAPSRPNNYGSVSGFGNVVYPGTGHPPAANRNQGIVDPSFAGRLGATVSGYPPYTGSRGGAGRGNQNVVYVPYAYGVPVYSEPMEPQVIYMQPQQPLPSSPQVVINQTFVSETARPVVREYTQDSSGGIHVYEPQSKTAPAAAAEEDPLFLIAFKDHTIYAARAYWVEGDTLHYVTGRNSHNQVSLDLVDRTLSQRLNREREVDFKL